MIPKPEQIVDPEFLNIPFKLGGRNIKEGVDCVGIMYCYLKKKGVTIPHTDGMPVSEDWREATPDRYDDAMQKILPRYGKLIIGFNQLKANDIIAFSIDKKKVAQAAVYIGKGYFLHIEEGKKSELIQLTERHKKLFFFAIRIKE
ncbi:MAG: NlpC/P60 family protein [Candidatus Orphnella occulta]|nr:NlpC/P60 family protein [Candidatus Orphnella occulta]